MNVSHITVISSKHLLRANSEHHTILKQAFICLCFPHRLLIHFSALLCNQTPPQKLTVRFPIPLPLVSHTVSHQAFTAIIPSKLFCQGDQ